MLKSLSIKNYAIIEDLSIDFNNGFNVFTGETGAGKSIIIGALSLLLKGRSDVSVIKDNKDKAVIEGVFSIDKNDAEMLNKLNDADIDYDDELIVRRTISRDNRNSIKINQCSVTLNFLTDLFDGHIDIHSQKDSQYLYEKKNHLLLLDRYSNTGDLLNEYRKEYRKYQTLANEYNELINTTYNQRDIEYQKYDFNELDNANLSVDEENELEEKEQRYKDSEKYVNSLSTVLNIYNGDKGIKEQLYDVIHELDLNDDGITDIRNSLNELSYSFDEEFDKLNAILKSFDNDTYSIDEIEERLYTYSRLKRKHSRTTEGLIKLKEELQEKILFFEDREQVLADKEKELNNQKTKCINLAEKMSDLRKKSSIKLSEEIQKECKDLMLNNVIFKVEFKETELNSSGIDDVEFYIATNKGEEPKPLKNVSSGGEASRLLLSLKSIFASLNSTSLIIFDEIDSGVSGKVGLAMGLKMAKLAKSMQIISITHLSMVAACAASHYYIYKSGDEDITKTKVKELNYDEIISELATISSTDDSEKALEAARQLYENAQERVRNL